MINADLIKSEKRSAHFLAVDKGSLASMSRFLNRLLGLPVELQNSVFSYFSDTLLAVIAEAKRCGKYEGGIMDFGAAGERVEVQESQEFVCDPAFGTATTELHRVRSLTIILLAFMHSLLLFKSSLERVSNAVPGCIDGVYRKLRHESAMNIILRFLASYETTCICTYTRQCTAAARDTRWCEWLVLVIVRVRLQALLLLGDPGNPKELIRRPLCRH